MQILIDRLHGDRDHLYLIEKDSNAKTALDYLIQTDHEMACDPIVYLVQKLPDSMRNAVILDYLHTLTVSKTSCSHKIIEAGFAAQVGHLIRQHGSREISTFLELPVIGYQSFAYLTSLHHWWNTVHFGAPQFTLACSCLAGSLQWCGCSGGAEAAGLSASHGSLHSTAALCLEGPCWHHKEKFAAENWRSDNINMFEHVWTSPHTHTGCQKLSLIILIYIIIYYKFI